MTNSQYRVLQMNVYSVYEHSKTDMDCTYVTTYNYIFRLSIHHFFNNKNTKSKHKLLLDYICFTKLCT